VVWIFDIFIDVIKNGKENGVKAKDSAYGSLVLSSQVVNLVFTGIFILSGTNCLSFVRLLSALVKMEVAFDKEAAYSLKDLLNRNYSASGGLYSPFFQSLLELMLHIEKLSGGPIKFEPEKVIKAPTTMPSQWSAKITGEYSDGSHQSFQFRGEWKCTSDGKLQGEQTFDDG